METVNESDGALLERWRSAAASGAARQLRIKSGVSAREVARRARVSWSAAHYYERAERVPHGEAGLRWAKVMERLAAEVLS